MWPDFQRPEFYDGNNLQNRCFFLRQSEVLSMQL